MTMQNNLLRGLPLSFAALLLASAPAFGSGPESSPAEQAQTEQLNHSVAQANAATDAQTAETNAVYQAQTKRYQEQLRDYRAGKANYEEKAARYLAERDHYVARYARFHRVSWPASANQRLIVDTTDILGANVHTANGNTVGHVVEIALVDGRVNALRVDLEKRTGDVWIEAADLRFDADRRVVMTDLDRHDLAVMSRETF